MGSVSWKSAPHQPRPKVAQPNVNSLTSPHRFLLAKPVWKKLYRNFVRGSKKSASKRIRELIPGKNDIAFSFKSEYLLQVIVNGRAEVRQISFRFIESLLCLILDNRRSSYLAPKNVERENFVENDFATAKSNHLDIGR